MNVKKLKEDLKYLEDNGYIDDSTEIFLHTSGTDNNQTFALSNLSAPKITLKESSFEFIQMGFTKEIPFTQTILPPSGIKSVL